MDNDGERVSLFSSFTKKSKNNKRAKNDKTQSNGGGNGADSTIQRNKLKTNSQRDHSTITMKRRRSLLLTLASALVLFCTSATGFDYKVFPSFIASPTLNLAASPSFQTSAWRSMDVHNVCFGNNENNWSRNFGKAVSISNTWMLVIATQ